MITLVCLLEEPSAKKMLEVVLPRIVPPAIQIRYISFQGKQDLERNVTRKIQHWLIPDSYFLIMRDQDSGNCLEIKQNLVRKTIETGKPERCLIRIACHELEAFYLGDLAAVEAGLGIRALDAKQNNRKYREPDTLSNAAEELSNLTRGSYQKIDGSRNIAPHLKLDGTNRSRSFNVLIRGVRNLLGSQ